MTAIFEPSPLAVEGGRASCRRRDRARLTLSDVVRMRRVEVRGPDLRLWRVGRRWSPWRPRMRNIRLRIDDGLNFGSAFDDISAGGAGGRRVFFVGGGGGRPAGGRGGLG